MFDYSILERPTYFYAYDLDEFYDYRGFFYKYDNDFLPGEIVTEENELIPAARRALDGEKQFDIKAFRDRFMGACDGHSADKICDHVANFFR